ncbi:hypothetical protein QBC47DRAFT_291315 [Echria macrotheca]|uniref:Uncharacterized protein n=1 Tax=Echria macrotheca TaxID=438768 RepID=A0AAJ0FGV7_9PEZI|nr:hypothetical protein QBC47DRAFT_291315 [Echria macrotheca]
MSSPDPLNDSDASQQLLSSRQRVTRSQATVRHYSLGSSPKKQTFELDVGNQISPQKILVTVEAEDAAQFTDRSVNRRLFQSPSVKRSARRTMAGASATTTIVPLRGLTDDESNMATDATPRKRGRPRAATPAKTTKRKRQGTPSAKKTAAQPRRNARGSSFLASEASADDQATPRPTSRARAGTKRKASSPIKESSVAGSQPRKRGRPRKQAALSPELAALTEQERAMDAEAEDNASMGQVEDNISVAGSRVNENHGDAMEDDIWLATMSEQPTPVPRRSNRTKATVSSNAPAPPPQPAQAAASDRAPSYDPFQDWDALGSGGHSDVESHASGQQNDEERQDTLMASEEFTMISLGSLPSMQASMLASSMMATEPQDLGEETSLIIDRALESLRQSQRAAQEDAIEQTESGDAPETNLSQPPPETRSSQPASPQAPNRSPRRANKLQSLGRQLAIKSLQSGAAGPPERPQVLDPVESHDTSAYDDSFSEIPEEVLIAATPRRLRQSPTKPREDTSKTDLQPSIERPSSVNHSNPHSDSNRLLTPDETPSPIPSEEGDENIEHEKSIIQAADDDIPSSPPIPSGMLPRQDRNPDVRHTRANSTETPADQISAFKSPARALLDQSINLPAPEPQPRPTLSPIVRAGRALQMVTSDPPSPPGRDSVLRSPFRSSVRSSQSPAPTPQKAPAPPPPANEAPVPAQQRERSWFDPLSQIKSFVVQGAMALSPGQRATAQMEDPFGPGSANSPVPASLRNFVSSLRGGQRAARDTSFATEDSAKATGPNDEDAMSWQGENYEAEDQPRDAGVSQSSSLRVTHGSPAKEFGVDVHGTLDEQASSHGDTEVDPDEELEEPDDEEEREESQELDEEEEEDDIWAFEAKRPTPGKQKAAAPRSEEVEPPRRNKIPSPWRRAGDRTASQKQSANRFRALSQEDDAEEFSMLSQQVRGVEKLLPPVAPRNVDLSAFFSSPAAIPDPSGMAGASFGLFKALDAPVPKALAENRNPRLQKETPDTESRDTQPFADVTNRQESLLQPRRQQQMPQPKLFRPPSRATTERPASPAKSGFRRETLEPSSPTTPERTGFDHVPQKQNFTPRSRQAANTLLQPRPNSLFGGTQIPLFTAPMSTEPEAEEEEESTGFVRPLKPLPSRAQSPSKSCIRSPLKPKTPGRVVEFTSSTLSPLAQAQVRAERRASASPEKQLSSASDISSITSSASTEDKENQEEEDPLRVQKLSQTQWTRDHWVRLDELLQARRQGILQFQLQLSRHARDRGVAGRQNRSVESQMLLGKLMRARGREIPVAEWHLDVVNAFRDEVGWWDEVDLVKRVLGLLVGEDLRRKGLVPRHRSSSVVS